LKLFGIWDSTPFDFLANRGLGLKEENCVYFDQSLAIILPCGTIIESADLFRKAGFVFYPEQFFAAVFALAGALVYLAVPAGKGREREAPSLGTISAPL